MSSVELVERPIQYGLSRIVEAHKGDVKCVQSTSEGVIVSGGRDEVVRFWAKRAGDFAEVNSFQQEKGMVVNSIGYYEGSDEWRLFVGRKDGSLNIYGPGSSAEKPLHSLRLHEQNIACIFVDEQNSIILTGSWDKSVIVFSIQDLAQENMAALKLVGHTLSVLAVCTFPDNPGFYLSGSSDRTVRLWHADKEIRQYQGHTDVVRALVVLSRERFLSASNDATVRLWHVEAGVCLAKFTSMVDHYIYSIIRLDDGFVTTSEGGHIEIWKKTILDDEASIHNSQLIHTPAQSMWSACALLNGDLVTAGSDGKIYVWTTNEKRKAPTDIVETFDAAVAARVAKELEEAEKQAHSEVVIKVALDDGTPQMELRYVKGSDPSLAAEKFIQENNLPISYINEITEYIKANIPEARAAAAAKHRPQETQRVEVDGEHWDYAFDITVDDGRQLRLCYNAGEDVDYAAQRFVEKYNLPMKFLAKVSGFLRSQMSEAGFTPSSSGFQDPFTGGTRYVPDVNASSTSDSADPFTGEGRYIPGSSSNNTSSGGGDPFTSGGRYIPGATDASLVPNATMPVDKKKPRSELCPIRSYFLLGVENLSQKAKDKLREVNENQTALKLNGSQLESLELLMEAVPGKLAVDDTLVSALDLGLQWGIHDILPVVDLFRIALLHRELNEIYCNLKGRGSETHQRLTALLISEPSDPVRAVLCRCISNAFAHEWGREMLMTNVDSTATIVAQQVLHPKAVVQVAAATALANWSFLLLQRSETVTELGPREDLVRAFIKVYENEDSFGGRSEVALIRLLQALVTLMWGDSAVIRLAKQRNVSTIVNRVKDAVVEEAGKALARDIVEMTHAV